MELRFFIYGGFYGNINKKEDCSYNNNDFDVTITEIDKYSDSATKDTEIKINHKETAEQIITVVENNGRYKGNIAKRKVTVSVKRTGKVWLIR